MPSTIYSAPQLSLQMVGSSRQAWKRNRISSGPFVVSHGHLNNLLLPAKGILGGGSQFGVVVEFVFKLYPYEGPYGSGVLAYKGSELANVTKVIQVCHCL